MKQTAGSIEGEHVLLTGPIDRPIYLADGQTVDVSPPYIEVSHFDDEQIEEINHRIGMHWVENGHPDDREIDRIEGSPTEGQMVQRPFDYQPPKRFAHEMKGKKPVGTPHHKKKGV